MWISELERTELQWRIKKRKSARIYRVFAMYRAEKNTAAKLAVTREGKTLKSHVNATIQPVH
jgi:hypothetical protein